MVVDKSAKDDDGPAPVEVEPARTKSLGLLKNLPRKREAVRQMTPSWFTVTMGTGSVAITVGTFPFAFSGQQEIAWAIWWLNIVLFAFFSLLFLARALFFSSTMVRLFEHPNQSLFMGAIPMAFSTITNGVVLFWVPRFGVTASYAVHAMFWINLPAVLGCILLVPLSMFTWHKNGLQSMSAVWLLPVVPACVAANTAGVVAASMTSAYNAVTVMYVGVCLLGIGFLLSYQICTIYYQRLTFHSLPAREVIVSSFLPVGPMAMSAWALLNLGKAAAVQLPQYFIDHPLPDLNVAWMQHEVVPIFSACCSSLSMFLWGFATWWLLLAVCSITSTLQKGIPFNLGWWGAIFPMGVYTGVTSQLGKTVHSHSFQVMGAIATCTHVLMWLVVIVLTVIHAWTGRLFHAPCLSQSRPGGCSGGLPTSGAQDPAARAACKLEEQLAQCATQCQPSSRAASPEPAKAAHQADGACHAAAV